MSHLIFWFLSSIVFFIINLSFFLLTLLIVSSLFHLLSIRNHFIFSLLIPFSILLIYVFGSYPISGIISVLSSLIIFFLDPVPTNQPNINAWNLLITNLNIAITIRETLHISDPTFFFLRRVNLALFSFSSSLLIIIFCSSHQIFILILITICSSTAILIGTSLSFFSSLLSLPLSPLPQDPLSPFIPPDSSSSIQFAYFLNKSIDTHPLGAIVEESFYEDNLQMGDFFIAYPIFFNAVLPSSITLSSSQEIARLWHTIRWESAFSKQTGSASSRWSSLYGLKFSSIPSSAHSVHTPLIPVFNEELFSALTEMGLPTFDPFNQPPEWSPYNIVTSLIGWSEEENNEERLVEIEEED